MKSLQDKSENLLDAMKEHWHATTQQNPGMFTESQGSRISSNEGRPGKMICNKEGPSGNAEPSLAETRMDIDWDSWFPPVRVGEPWPDTPNFNMLEGWHYNPNP